MAVSNHTSAFRFALVTICVLCPTATLLQLMAALDLRGSAYQRAASVADKYRLRAYFVAGSKRVRNLSDRLDALHAVLGVQQAFADTLIVRDRHELVGRADGISPDWPSCWPSSWMVSKLWNQIRATST